MNELEEVVTGSVARRVSRAREIVSLVICAAARSRSKSPVCTETFVTRNCRTSDTDCACADGETPRAIAVASRNSGKWFRGLVNFRHPRRIDRPSRSFGSHHTDAAIFFLEITAGHPRKRRVATRFDAPARDGKRQVGATALDVMCISFDLHRHWGGRRRDRYRIRRRRDGYRIRRRWCRRARSTGALPHGEQLAPDPHRPGPRRAAVYGYLQPNGSAGASGLPGRNSNPRYVTRCRPVATGQRFELNR